MTTSCCGGVQPVPSSLALASPRLLGRIDARWTDGVFRTLLGDVPRARTRLSLRDHLGTLAVRTGLGRMRYRVPPGLYAVGDPAADSPVLVSANYKLSFDHLRSALAGRDAWILVLDTRGINVWCAAGKGTFGTGEIVGRVHGTGLARLVSHRRLVLPQLGAPGVAAHEVRAATGFHVVYGPVRATDLPAFLDARLKADPEMRRVRFRLWDRLTLVPVEVVIGARYALPAAAALLLLGGLGPDGYSLARLASTGLRDAALTLASFLVALVLGPALLPWLPGRAFSLKGAWLGLALVGSLAALGLPGPGVFGSWLHLAAWTALGPAITSFLVMNLTGASTYTSLSGVLREMRFAVPAQTAAGAIGLALQVAALVTMGGPAR
ncbi:MAG TPA: mercury methylation corrinoid protein HgcA [Vicinamibacteria bacterium]